MLSAKNGVEVSSSNKSVTHIICKKTGWGSHPATNQTSNLTGGQITQISQVQIFKKTGCGSHPATNLEKIILLFWENHLIILMSTISLNYGGTNHNLTFLHGDHLVTSDKLVFDFFVNNIWHKP